MARDCPGPDALARWLADELSTSQASLIEVHLETCPSCQAVVESLLGRPTEKNVPVGTPSERQAEEEFLRRLAIREQTACNPPAPPTPSLDSW